MDVERRFEEIDEEITLGFAEMREYLKAATDNSIKGNSAEVTNEAEQRLGEVDRQVKPSGDINDT